MSDFEDAINAIANAPGTKPEVSKMESIPEVRNTEVDASDGVVAADVIAGLTKKQSLPVSKASSIPDNGRSLPQPQYISDGKDVKDGDSGKNMEFAEFLVNNYSFGRINKTLYVLQDGIYQPLLEHDFDLLLRQAAFNKDLPEELSKTISAYKSSELYAWLLSHPSVPELPEMPNKRYIAVQNGILDLKKKKLFTFESIKEMPVLFNRINAKYIAYSDDEWFRSYTLQYLKRLADPNCKDQCVNALLYLVGKISSNDRSGKNLYYLYGASNNGKSVFAAIIQSILGVGNYGNLSLKDLTGQFAMINLRHALANISTDEETEAWTSGTASLIKRITGHDTLQVDVKYERMQQFRPYCVLLCMGNAEPKYSKDLDAGGAISKRLFLIPTGPTVTEPDENLLEDKLLPEKDLFFSLAIDYYMTHSHPQKIVDVEEIIFPDISPKELFSCWIRDCIKLDNDDEQIHQVDELWANYVAYIKNVPGGSRMKRRAFEMECAVRLSSYKSPSRYNNRSCYVGLQLRSRVYQPFEDRFGGW